MCPRRRDHCSGNGKDSFARSQFCATAKQGDFSPAETEIASAALPAISGRASRDRDRSSANVRVRVDFEEFLGGLPLPTMILRWNLKPIYQNQCRARVLRSVGERTRGSETNKSEFPGSRRDRGSMSCSQATMGGCAITNALSATNRIHRGTGAAPAIA